MPDLFGFGPSTVPSVRQQDPIVSVVVPPALLPGINAVLRGEAVIVMKQRRPVSEIRRERTGPAAPHAQLARRQARHVVCPCTEGRTCQWPHCARIGDGLGHHP